MVHIYIYISSQTTIFLVVRLLLLRHNYMFRPPMLAIFRLYMRNLSTSYTNMCGEFTVCGVGWVGDLVLCWRKGYGLGLFWGLCLNTIHVYLHLSISELHFWYVQSILEKLYYLWTKSKVPLYYIQFFFFTYLGLIVNISTSFLIRSRQRVSITKMKVKPV